MRHRVASSLQVPRTALAEYERRHRNLWPELRDAIAKQGGHNFSIFAVPELDRVFSYIEIDDIDRWTAGAQTELTRRWWQHMAEIMPTHADGAPLSAELREVFHQD